MGHRGDTIATRQCPESGNLDVRRRFVLTGHQTAKNLDAGRFVDATAASRDLDVAPHASAPLRPEQALDVPSSWC